MLIFFKTIIVEAALRTNHSGAAGGDGCVTFGLGVVLPMNTFPCLYSWL